MATSKGQLEDEIVVGGLPGGTGVSELPPTPGQTIEVRAAADREYVAGQRVQWYANIARALPIAADDLQQDFGDDVYARMLLDSQVRSVVNVIKAGIIETGMNLAPAIDAKDDPGYEAASALVDRAERMLDDLTTPLDDVLWDMLDGVPFGNTMAEQVYTLETAPSGKQEYDLTTLAVKPRESVAFVVDAYLNVLGVLGRIPGQPFGVQQGMLLADLQHVSNFLPRAKFAIFTFRPHNGDPRGISILRPAFAPWQAKIQITREFLKYLTQFATPSLVGFTAENAQPYTPQNADGTPQLDALGNPIIRTPEQDMLTALQAFANGTVSAFPFGAQVKEIINAGSGDAFLKAFAFYDRQITKAVLNQTLATEESEHQTRAATSSQKDVLDVLIRQAKRPLERMLERDVLGTWLRLNGQEDLLPLRPRVTLGQAPQEDLATLWTAAASLHKANYLHKSQLTDLDSMMGLPERDPPGATSIPIGETVLVKSDTVSTDDGTADDDGQDQGTVGMSGTSDDGAAMDLWDAEMEAFITRRRGHSSRGGGGSNGAESQSDAALLLPQGPGRLRLPLPTEGVSPEWPLPRHGVPEVPPADVQGCVRGR